MSGHFDAEDAGSNAFNKMVEILALPGWAVGLTDQYMTLGAQLCTRDGRRTGNAVVVDIEARPLFLALMGTVFKVEDGFKVAIVLTDMGNQMTLNEAELAEMFYQPKYIIDLNDRRVAARLAELQEG